MSRPQLLSDITGQQTIIENLRILISASKQTGEVLPHILFEGGPGLGKTTLSMAIANEIGANIEIANGATLKTIKDIQPYLARIDKGSIIFIDEIHSVAAKVQEYLYPVMEDFRMDIGGCGQTLSIPVDEFTLIGATTHGGKLLPPIYDRFKFKQTLSPYSVEDLVKIAEKKVGEYGMNTDTNALTALAKASRSTARILLSLLEWVRDCYISEKIGRVDDTFVIKSLARIGINKSGIDDNDRKYITCLEKSNEPVGVNTIQAKTGIPRVTIEERIEPYLLQLGIIDKTKRGRILCRDWLLRRKRAEKESKHAQNAKEKQGQEQEFANVGIYSNQKRLNQN